MPKRPHHISIRWPFWPIDKHALVGMDHVVRECTCKLGESNFSPFFWNWVVCSLLSLFPHFLFGPLLLRLSLLQEEGSPLLFLSSGYSREHQIKKLTSVTLIPHFRLCSVLEFLWGLVGIMFKGIGWPPTFTQSALISNPYPLCRHRELNINKKYTKIWRKVEKSGD
jgi:hypothetical protein